MNEEEWTAGLLKEHFDRILLEFEKRYNQRFDDLKSVFCRAEDRVEKSFEIISTFLPKNEYDRAHRDLSNKVDDLGRGLNQRIDAQAKIINDRLEEQVKSLETKIQQLSLVVTEVRAITQ